MSLVIESLLVKTYVNCVKFLNEKHILASAGNTLQVYNVTTSKLLNSKAIFESQRIHGIFVNNDQVLLCGGFNLALVHITIENENMPINIIHQWTSNQWVQDATFLQCNKYGVLGSSNVLYCYKKENGNVLLEKKFQCKEKSVLYCGKILGTSWSNAVVLCGTVFSQITIWSPMLNDCNIVHRLIGHQGVIFSVTYHEANKTICSTSDDRSVRLWQVEMKCSNNILESWKHAKITLVRSIFGHTARVWKNLQLNNGKIISIGEDGQLKVWCGDTSVHSWNTHQNGNIWSIDYNETSKLIVTGGGDAGIYVWPMSHVDNLIEPHEVDVKLAPGDFPRQVVIARNNKLLLYTNNGIILSCEPHHSKQVLEDARFKSYCILSISKNKEYYSTASISGDILVFHGTSDEQVTEYNVGKEKIFSFHWLAENHFVICKPQGELILLEYLPQVNCIQAVHNFVLPVCKERWLTAACLTDNLFICGDRDGSIHVYNSPSQCLLKTYHKIHSRLGVSCVEYNSCCKTLMSIGRDGFLRHWEIAGERNTKDNVSPNMRTYSINDGHVELSEESPASNAKSHSLYHVSADKLPLEWPVHIHTVSTGADIYIIGFHEVHLVIWSTREQKIIFKLKCGGGHRSWDYFLNESKLYFSFIKQKGVYHVDVDLFKLTRPAIVQSFHRDEINALVCVRMNQEQLLVSGGEDNTLRVSLLSPHTTNTSSFITAPHRRKTNSLSNKTDTLHTCLILRSHISSIRCLSYVQVVEDVYIASGGGRAQIKIWKLSRKSKNKHGSSPIENNSSGVSENPYNENTRCSQHVNNSQEHNPPGPAQYQCKELISHMLNGEDRKEKSWRLATPRINPETRYMDIALYYVSTHLYIATACSDGYIRVFLYDIEANSFSCFQELNYHGKCVLKVHIVEFRDLLLLCSMSTNGDLALWDFRILMNAARTNSSSAKSKNTYKTKDNLNTSLSENQSSSISPVTEALTLSALQTSDLNFRKTTDQIMCTEDGILISSHSTELSEENSSKHSNAELKKTHSNPAVKSNLETTPSPLIIYKLHEGGVNSFDSRTMGSELFLASGGDDCTLALTVLTADLKLTRQMRQLRAHDSQITGVKFLDDNSIVSSSVDQRIFVWTWGVSELETLTRDISSFRLELVKFIEHNAGLYREVLKLSEKLILLSLDNKDLKKEEIDLCKRTRELHCDRYKKQRDVIQSIMKDTAELAEAYEETIDQHQQFYTELLQEHRDLKKERGDLKKMYMKLRKKNRESKKSRAKNNCKSQKTIRLRHVNEDYIRKVRAMSESQYTKDMSKMLEKSNRKLKELRKNKSQVESERDRSKYLKTTPGLTRDSHAEKRKMTDLRLRPKEKCPNEAERSSEQNDMSQEENDSSEDDDHYISWRSLKEGYSSEQKEEEDSNVVEKESTGEEYDSSEEDNSTKEEKGKSEDEKDTSEEEVSSNSWDENLSEGEVKSTRQVSEELIRISQLDTCIPDVHGLDVMGEGRVCVFGCGVHIVQVVEDRRP